MALTPSSPSHNYALDSGEGASSASPSVLPRGFPTCALPLGSCACQSGASCLLLCLKAISSELCPLTCCAALFSPPHSGPPIPDEHIKPRFLLETVTHSARVSQAPAPKPKTASEGAGQGRDGQLGAEPRGGRASLMEAWTSGSSHSGLPSSPLPWPGSQSVLQIPHFLGQAPTVALDLINPNCSNLCSSALDQKTCPHWAVFPW